MLRSEFLLGNAKLSVHTRPYVVAEIGVNHNGDLKLAMDSVRAAAAAGADAVKFQTFHTDEFMAGRATQYEYISGGKTVRESMYDMFARLEMPEEWHSTLSELAHDHDLAFLSSAADRVAVDILMATNVPAIKIASEDLINLPLLEYVGRQHHPVILSTGMGSVDEIDQAVNTLRDHGCPSLLLLHCVSLYPAPDDQVNLRRLVGLQQRYNSVVGFSDHTIGYNAAVAATAMGAVLIEKHFTLSHDLAGPDHAFSADPTELAALVQAVSKTSTQLGRIDLQPARRERDVQALFRRSVVANREIPADTEIHRDMLCLKRPGDGIAPSDLNQLVGKRTRRLFRMNEALSWDGIQ